MLLLAPGERADLVITPRAPNTTARWMWIPFERGFGTAFARDPEPLMMLAIDGRRAVAAPALPTRLRTIDPIDPSKATVQRLELTQTSVGMTTTLGINGKAFDESMPIMAKVWRDNYVWEIVNTTEAHHPFHLHGFFFQQLDDAGKAADQRVEGHVERAR